MLAALVAARHLPDRQLQPGPELAPKLPEPPFLSTLPIRGWSTCASSRRQVRARLRWRPACGSMATGFSHCRDFFPGGEPPALQIQPQQRELCFSAFAVLHSGQTKTPVFVVERLNRKLWTRGQGLKRSDKFYDRCPPAPRRARRLDDYRRSGYSRGHMAPAGASTRRGHGPELQPANMVPQDQTHNGGVWEQSSRTRAATPSAPRAMSMCSPARCSTASLTIGPGKVHVPSHIFKLVYDASTGVPGRTGRPTARIRG
ncbi:Nuclease EXOG, mitochondrial [Manis javanica]|nr:Nuclease EXOG, mitochondrial [Manis javanica]